MIIDNNSVLSINFNNQEVEILKFNGEIVWKKQVSSYDYQVSKEYQGLTTDDNINYAYVYDDSKWYALNTDKQYEQWGVYEDTDDINSITKYEGKLATVSSTSEYEYSNGSWKYLGEASGGFGLIGQIDRDNPPSTFPIDFYLKKDDLDEWVDLNITSPNWSQRIEVRLFPGMTEYTVEDEGMRYEGTVEEETINGVVYVHFSCPSYPNDSIDVERIDWWNDPIDYYGNSTVLPKQYDNSIFDEYPLYQGYYYDTEDEIKIGKDIIYNIGGILKEYDGKAFVTSEKTYEDVYMIFDVNGGSDTNPNGWGVEVIYDEDFNVTANEDLQNDITYYGVMNKDAIGVQGSSCPINFINCAIPNSVTSIVEYAFLNCSKLTSVTIPDSVTTIGNNAFAWCGSLASVEIGDSVTTIGSSAFNGCLSLTSVTIPDSVTTIGGYAFYGCTSLTSVTIPDSVTSLGDSVFASCSGLTTVEIGDSVTSISNSAFTSCSSLTSVTIPDSVTSIGGGAFYRCSSLTSVTIPDSVTSIGGGAFNIVPTEGTLYCYRDWYDNLTSTQITRLGNVYKWTKVWLGPPIGEFDVFITFTDGSTRTDSYSDGIIPTSAYTNGITIVGVEIGDGITSIGNYAFRNCSRLTSVEIGDGITSIGNYAFQYCTKLTSVTIPDSVTSISSYAFQNCSGLTSVEIGDSVTSIGNYAFNGCTKLTSVIIPDSVTSISSYAFQNCSGLTSVTIPDGVTTIEGGTFWGCSNLTTVVIPDSVTSIGNNAFYGCSGLTSVEIGDSVTTIGGSVFYNCSSLTSVTIPSSVATIDTNAFNNAPTEGTLYCSKYWYNNLDSTKITNLGNVYNWTKVWIDPPLGDYDVLIIFQGGTTKTDIYSDGTVPSSAYTGGYTIVGVEIGDGITSIGNYAFNGCTSLTSVTIPDSVTSIGNNAFQGCNALTSVEIGDSVETIGAAAFYWCTSLASVTIPDSVTSIGSSGFSNCSNLTYVDIGDSVTSIGDSGFSNCYALTYVDIGDSVTSIGNGAFRSCSGLTSVTIPDSVVSIGDSAFSNCESLTSVEIGDSVTSIGDSAFGWCNRLTSVTIPDSVISISSYAFYYVPTQGTLYCYKDWYDSLTSTQKTNLGNVYNWTKVWLTPTISGKKVKLTLNNGTEQIDEFGLGEVSFAKYLDRTDIVSAVFGDEMTKVGQRSFEGCSNMTSVTLSNSVTLIGGSGFNNCISLNNVIIPTSVTEIRVGAFMNCTSLTNFEYEGTIAQWNSIVKGDMWNMYSQFTVVHCSDGDVAV